MNTNRSASAVTMRNQGRAIFAGALLRRQALINTPSNRASLRLGPRSNNTEALLKTGNAALNLYEIQVINNNNTIPPPVPLPPIPTPIWSKFGYNNKRQSAYNGPASANLHWTFQAGLIFSSACIANAVFIGSEDAKVYALNPLTGQVLWSFQTNGIVDSSPTLGGDGNLYVSSEDGYLYVLNPYSGQRIWSFLTYTSGIGQTQVAGANSSFTIDSERAYDELKSFVYVGSVDGNLYCLDTFGIKHWEFQTGGWIQSSPAVNSQIDLVYVGSSDYNVYAIHRKWGRQVWSYATESIVYSSPAIGSDNTVYIGSLDNNLYALNGVTGVLKWKYKTDGAIYSSPAISSENIYIVSNDGYLYSISLTGSLVWKYQISNSTGVNYSSPTIGLNGTIYVGSCNKYIYALTSAGVLLWSYETGGIIESSPSIGPDGTLYIGSNDGKLYAFS